MVIVHHPAATKGGWLTTNWDHFDSDLEPLVDVYSIWGSSECSEQDGNAKPIRRLGGLAKHAAGCFVRDALDRGYKLGLIGGSDGHDGRPGCSALYKLPPEENPNAYTFQHPPYYSGGIQGIWAKELTRKSLWDAMLQRHTYATTGERILLRFRLDGAPMGETVYVSGTSAQIKIEAIGTAKKIDRVEIVRNSHIWKSFDGHGKCINIEESVARAPDTSLDYLYIRLLQSDGHIAWSSPIWICWPN